MRSNKLPAQVLPWLVAVLTALAISACSNDRPVYHGAEYYKNLEVPPDLTEPDTTDELKVPKPTDEAIQRFRDNNKLDTEITPKFDGIRVVSYAGDSWIEIDNKVETVWPRLLEFWQNEGIELVQVRPLLGFMETDWTERLIKDKGFWASMAQSFDPDTKDKFRARVERFDNGEKTRLYIAHTRIERRVYGDYANDSYWTTLPSNLEAEREIIYRMALFAGLDKKQSQALLDNYRPYSSLVKVDSTNTTALTMKGSMDFVWRRAMRALDRMQMQDIVEHKDIATIDFSVVKLAAEDLQIQSKDDVDELAESSWLMQLITGSDDEDDLTGDAERQYRLELTELGNTVQIEVKDARNSQQTDDSGAVYSTALAEQLRDMLVEKLE
jgi:outer membrane protein assembly factor BamC